MGLDGIEFIMAIEEALCLHIPDADATQLATPGMLIDYLATRLPTRNEEACLSQRAFYKVRAALVDRLEVPRTTVLTGSRLDDLFPEPGRASKWLEVQAIVGAKTWPAIGRESWFPDAARPKVERVGELAMFLLEREPTALREATEGWTRAQIAEVVHRIIDRELGIPRHKYTEDSTFIRDMGVQ